MCSYIIYTGIEEEVITSDSIDDSSPEDTISEDEHLREIALSEEIDDEKDLE